MPGHRKKLRGNARRLVAEELQRDSERQPRFVSDNAPVAIACCDTEARYKFVNRYYAERHGLMPEQVVGKRVLEIVGEQAWSTYRPYFRECLAGKTIEFELEIDLPYSVGERQFVHCCYEPEWRDGTVVGLIATITNITSRKRAEQRLRDNEITFRQLVETSPFGVYGHDGRRSTASPPLTIHRRTWFVKEDRHSVEVHHRYCGQLGIPASIGPRRVIDGISSSRTFANSTWHWRQSATDCDAAPKRAAAPSVAPSAQRCAGPPSPVVRSNSRADEMSTTI